MLDYLIWVFSFSVLLAFPKVTSPLSKFESSSLWWWAYMWRCNFWDESLRKCKKEKDSTHNKWQEASPQKCQHFCCKALCYGYVIPFFRPWVLPLSEVTSPNKELPKNLQPWNLNLDLLHMKFLICAGNEDHYKYLVDTSFVHVDDVARAHIFLFEYPNAKGRYICSALDVTIDKLSEFLSARYPEYQIPNAE